MALVKNPKIKMEWEQSGWLTTKGKKGKPGTFCFASQIYTNNKGEEIPVLFCLECAFIWASDIGTDDEDVWSLNEVKTWCKENFEDGFPVMYDECYRLTRTGTTETVDEALDHFGLLEHKADIEARLNDILPLGDEIIVKL